MEMPRWVSSKLFVVVAVGQARTTVLAHNVAHNVAPGRSALWYPGESQWVTIGIHKGKVLRMP